MLRIDDTNRSFDSLWNFLRARLADRAGQVLPMLDVGPLLTHGYMTVLGGDVSGELIRTAIAIPQNLVVRDWEMRLRGQGTNIVAWDLWFEPFTVARYEEILTGTGTRTDPNFLPHGGAGAGLLAGQVTDSVAIAVPGTAIRVPTVGLAPDFVWRLGTFDPTAQLGGPAIFVCQQSGTGSDENVWQHSLNA